jgi:predicted  nucleic acid-binding Zn-ribbon protein
MEDAEAAQKEADRVRQATTRVLGEAEAEHGRLAGEHSTLKEEIARTERLRGELRSGIPAQVLALYERLRGRMPDGVAAAAVIQGKCEGCHTSLPSAEIQRARRTEGVEQCSVCGRMLHVPHG